MIKKPKPPVPTVTYPMRINRYLALKGHSTRRGADTLIEQKKVFINGVLAKLGDKVTLKDVIEVKNAGKDKNTYAYLAYNKAPGIVTSTPAEGERSIEDVVKFRIRVFPIGRLDKESRGLIILTNDGRVTDRLLSPEHDHEKEYKVRVNKPLHEGFLDRMRRGMKLEDFTTKPAEVEETGEQEFHITLTEGKRHQIRRMCTAAGYEVVDLQRVRIMNVVLGNIGEGQYKELTGKELKGFLENIGLTS